MIAGDAGFTTLDGEVIDGDAILVRAGVMFRESIKRAMEGPLEKEGRLALCLFSPTVDRPASSLFAHRQACLTTPVLLFEACSEFDVEHTRDRGEDEHYTLWWPVSCQEYTDVADDILRQAFRGPYPVEKIDHDATTAGLRGLQSPPSK